MLIHSDGLSSNQEATNPPTFPAGSTGLSRYSYAKCALAAVYREPQLERPTNFAALHVLGGKHDVVLARGQ